jgi:hypothetical protein
MLRSNYKWYTKHVHQSTSKLVGFQWLLTKKNQMLIVSKDGEF